MDNEVVNILIIGGGPAGISAGLYAVRNGIKPLIFHTQNSKIATATHVNNYYGFPNGISGEELYQKGLEQAKNSGIDVKEAEVVGITFSNGMFEVDFNEDNKSKKIYVRQIILATGNKNLNPNIQNLNNYIGKGVCYCALCDGFFFKDKRIGILGDGLFAIHELKVLANQTKDITIYTNGLDKTKIENLLKENNFNPSDFKIIGEKIQSLEGTDKLEKVELANGQVEPIDGLFIALGQASSIDFAKTLGIVMNGNNITVNGNMETNIKNIYAAGDCTGGINQVEKAVYQGAVAGLNASKEIKLQNIGKSIENPS